MSAPHDTNVETQTKRHRGPVLGILLSIAAAGVLSLAIAIAAFNPDGDDPEQAADLIPPAADAERVDPADQPPATTTD